MRWEFSFLLLLLELLTRGEALFLELRTNSPYEREGSVVRFTRGFRANLTCTLEGTSGDANYLVAWYYNHVPINSSSSESLQFEGIGLEDGGWYTCSTTLNNQRYQFDFLVVVGGEPILNANFTDFSYRVQEGTRVEFPCFPQGTPQPVVEWFYRNGTVNVSVVNAGRLRVDQTSQSLVIIDTTAMDLTQTYFCRANNMFGSKELTYNNASIIDNAPAPPSGPDFPFASPERLIATVNQSTPDVELDCIASGKVEAGVRIKWLRNGTQLQSEKRRRLKVSRNGMGSGFYCCEIYNSTSSTENNVVVLDTHCVTLVFQTSPQFEQQRDSLDGTTYHLPRGTQTGLICRGSTKLSSPSSLHYDPPKLIWTGPNEIRPPNNNFTGLAYAVVDIEPANSGVYTCSGSNSVDTINTSVTLRYIDINLTMSEFLRADGWKANGSANITDYMNERVFLLPFSASDSIGETWLSQNFTLGREYTSFSISGRVRQSQPSNNEMGVFPAIEVFDEEGRPVAKLEHPERGSMAWQWVEKTLNHSRANTYTIRLALTTDNGTQAQRGFKRQSSNGGTAFFGDINVDAQPSETDDESDNMMLIIIIASSSAGGLVAVILVVVVVILCCVFCRRGKDNARPMRKITTLVKKASRKYRLPTAVKKEEQSSSPVPKEYEIPVPLNTYATLQGHSSGSNSGGAKNGEYTSINPHSLDEPSYYTTTHKGSKGKEVDEGGVHTYLEVIPPIPGHRASPTTSRSGSPLRPTTLATSAAPKKETDVLTSPDVLDGDSIEMYDYINADLGPM